MLKDQRGCPGAAVPKCTRLRLFLAPIQATSRSNRNRSTAQVPDGKKAVLFLAPSCNPPFPSPVFSRSTIQKSSWRTKSLLADSMAFEEAGIKPGFALPCLPCPPVTSPPLASIHPSHIHICAHHRTTAIHQPVHRPPCLVRVLSTSTSMAMPRVRCT